MRLSTARRSRAAGALVFAAGLTVGASYLIPSAEASGAQTSLSYACMGGTGDAGTISSDLAQLQQGGALRLSGTCDVGSLAVPADITLEGTEGSDPNVGTQLNGNLTESDGESSTIRDLQVNCNGRGNGITLDGWQDTVTHVTVSNCVNGIELDNPTNGTGNHVNDRITDNFIQGTTGYGFYVNDNGNGVTDGHFTGNYVAGGTSSIYMTDAAGWYVQNNHTYSQSGVAIYTNRMWGTKIEGNYIENWSGSGISGTVQSGAVGSVIDGNNVFQDDGGTVGSGGGTGQGIHLVANGTNCYVTVMGNTIVNTSTAAGNYGILGSGTGLTFTSSGNNVQGAGTASAATNGAVKTSGV